MTRSDLLRKRRRADEIVPVRLHASSATAARTQTSARRLAGTGYLPADGLAVRKDFDGNTRQAEEVFLVTLSPGQRTLTSGLSQ
jgi:hypothetical protein